MIGEMFVDSTRPLYPVVERRAGLPTLDSILIRMAELDNAPVEQLIERSLDSSFDAENEVGNPKSISSWDAIGALAIRADDEVLEAAKRLLESRDPWHRARGANIPGHFKEGVRTGERFDALSAALDTEEDDRTLSSPIHSIGHLHDPRCLCVFFRFVGHPNREVRRAVAMSMHADWGESAVAALCELCADQWVGVRDWATFQFRTSDVDSDEIRRCLKARIHDPDPPTRGEAVCALARRHDLACLKQLIGDLGNLDA